METGDILKFHCKNTIEISLVIINELKNENDSTEAEGQFALAGGPV